MQTLPLVTETVSTTSRSELIDVTNRLVWQVQANRVLEGMVLVYVPHTTAAVTINENADPDVKSDLIHKLAALIPQRESYYQHGEGNSDSHLKTSLVGNSVTVLVEAGKLVLGRWQGVYFCEFDGPRQRQMMLKVVKFGPTSD